MSDIVERLRSRAKYDGWSTEDVLSGEAADTIEALRAENARLREIAKKFMEGSMREADIRAVIGGIDIGGGDE